MSEKMKAAIRRLMEGGWNQGNLAVVDEVLAPDCVLHHDEYGDIRGPQAYREFMDTFRTAFPDLHCTIADMLTEGNKLSFRFRYTGTNKAALWGMAPTGRTIILSGTATDRFAGDKVEEGWSNWDAMGFFKQLGLVTDPATIEANKTLVRRFIEEIFNQGNLAVADEIIAADFWHRAPHTPELRGPEGLKQLAAGVRTGLADIHLTTDDLTAEADRVMYRWTITGTHRGDWMGVAPTGKRVAYTGEAKLRISGGKILEHFVEWDALGLYQQLGVVPALKQATAAAASQPA